MKTTKIGSLVAFLALALVAPAQETARRPVEGIMDNSFLVEEAYNQEAGVVQHIFNGSYGIDRLFGPENHTFDMSFTQEWPIVSQTHQFSYTVPYSLAWDGAQFTRGLGDVLLNYRYQAYLNQATLTGFSPRFTLVLPTGEYGKGFGNGALGYQCNLPFSTTLGDRWFVHLNVGVTYLPDVWPSPRQDLLHNNLGASAIYCVSDRFHLMLEWIGSWNATVLESGSVERQFFSLISPGLRYAFNFRTGSQLVLGLGAPIALTHTAPEIGAFLYISFEHRLFGKAN